MMTFKILIMCIILVESSGNDYAYNNESGATGCMQIKQILVDEINRRHDIGLTRWHCYNRSTSIWVFEDTVEHFATERLLGHVPTFRDCAGIWKDGPTGYNKDPRASDYYWQRILDKKKEYGL